MLVLRRLGRLGRCGACPPRLAGLYEPRRRHREYHDAGQYESHPCRFSAVHPLRVRVVRRGRRNRGPGAASVPLLPRLPHSSMLDALRRVAGFAVCFLASTTRPPKAVGRPSLHVVPPSRSHPAPDITALTWLTPNARRTHAANCPSPRRPPRPTHPNHRPRCLPSTCDPRPSPSLYDESLQRESERGKEAGGTRPFSVSASLPLALQVEPRRSPPLCCVAWFKFTSAIDVEWDLPTFVNHSCWDNGAMI